MFLNLVKEMLKASWANELKEDNLILIDKGYILSSLYIGMKSFFGGLKKN
ncbi:hypothetical protein [Clostridium saccharoperbutylacetonicum]